MYKAYKFRLYQNSSQNQVLSKILTGDDQNNKFKLSIVTHFDKELYILFVKFTQL